MSDDTARRERAERFRAGEIVRLVKYQGEQDAGNYGMAEAWNADDVVNEMVEAYLAGAREEAAIKDAQIASMRAEVIATWREMQGAGQFEAYRIMERMVDRLGYGRTDGNPSLAQAHAEPGGDR